MKTPIVEDRSFPKTKKGYCCTDCFDTLWSITWRDKAGHLKRAFENLSLPVATCAKGKECKGCDICRQNDDYEASPIVAGLYAPHATSGASPVIHESRFAAGLVKEKLLGFNREMRDDLNLKPKRTLVKNGKFKVHPDSLGLPTNTIK